MTRSCLVAIGIFFLSLPLAAQQVERFQYQYPGSTATSVSRRSSIILRPGALLDARSVSTPSLVTISGSLSGRHSGRTLLSDDQRTVQFIPDVPFAPGESVSVALGNGLRAATGERIDPRSFTFTTDITSDSLLAAARIPLEFNPDAAVPADTRGAERKEDAASILSAGIGEIPVMKVTKLDNPAPGRIYLSNLAFSATVVTSPHLMILDNAARPVFRLPLTHRAFDFRRHPNGQLSYFDDGLGYFILLDSSYNAIGTVGVGNGHTTDPHDLIFLPGGHTMLLGLEPHTVDMSTMVPDGQVATILDIVIQELDAAQNVVFEWRSRDHFQITDATHEDLTLESIDHVHPNSLEIDVDGNILMSSRHLDEVTKIDRQTGAVIWRMGGKHNQFTFINDPIGFSHQHDVRRLANGNLMLFDNGNFHTPARSRVVEYSINEANRTATLVWQYSHTPAVYSTAMGSAQRLPNGNTMIGWGAYPLVTEVHPDGTTAFEMTLPAGVFSYRTLRLPPATSRVRTSLTSPSNSTTDLPAASSLLSWETTGATTAYHLQVSSDSTFTSIAYDNAAIPDDSIASGPFAEWTQYWWRVRPIGPEIEGVWSDVWTFYTSGTPVYQALVAPPQGAVELAMAPTLHWGQYPAATAYELQLSNYDVTFNAPEIDTVVSSQYFWLDPIMARSLYYWRVRPIIGSQSGNWSQVWDFRTSSSLSQTLPERVAPIAPLDRSTLAQGAQAFEWSMIDTTTHPTMFRFEVAGDSEFRSLVVDSTLAGRSASIAGNRLPGGDYWWRVRATNVAGEQFGGPVFTFKVGSTTGVDEAAVAGGVSIYPNPAGQKATVRFWLEKPTSVTVRLMDLLGRPLSTGFQGQLSTGENTVTIPTGDIPNGTYLCSISTSGSTTVRRLVVAR